MIYHTFILQQEIKIELARKAIHSLIALVPLLSSFSRTGTLILLAAGMALYVCFELFRLRGGRIPVISAITAYASRRRDRGRFVLGPVTLGAGAMLSLILFPPIPSAIAIFALAAGDSVSSLAGKAFGRMRPAFLAGKSVEGSLACWTAVFFCTWAVCAWTGGESGLRTALVTASFTAAAEVLPLKDWDNIVIPLAAGAAALVLL